MVHSCIPDLWGTEGRLGYMGALSLKLKEKTKRGGREGRAEKGGTGKEGGKEEKKNRSGR